MRPSNKPLRDDGYATLTAIVLCGAAAMLCAGVLSVAAAEKRTEVRRMARVQQDEAFDTAVLQFAAKVASAQDPYRVQGSETVALPDGQGMSVTLTAESESAKWPIGKIKDVAPDVLSRAITLTASQIETGAITSNPYPPHNDCVRSLFSEFGQADPSRDRPTTNSALYASSAKDGQVWRIRAVSGGRVEERRVRFLGDPRRPFATISVENLTLGEMPACTALATHS